MNRMLQAAQNERGSAVLIALSLIVMFTTVALMSFKKSITDVDVSFNEVRYEQALRLADAGLERALVQLEANPAWRAGFTNENLGHGKFTVQVLDSASKVTTGDTVVVRSTASTNTAPKSTVTVERWLVPNPGDNPFKWAAFGDDKLFMQNNACTDSYNSDSGTYAATLDTLGGNAGSNGQIHMKNNATVGGDLMTSSNGNFLFENHPVVYGDTSSKMPPEPIDPIPAQEFTDAQANNKAPAGISGPYSWSPSAYDLFVDGNKTITLQSGTYYFKSIFLKNNSKLKLAAGAKVVIYVANDIMAENNCEVNAGGKPANLIVKTKGTKLEFQNNSEFRGAIYAPNVDFMHQNNAGLYGSIIAKTVELKNNACVHYDRALSKLGSGSTGRFLVVGWREL